MVRIGGVAVEVAAERDTAGVDDADHVRVIGALAAVVAMYLPRSLAETATAETMHNKEAGSVVGLVRNHPRAVLIVLAVSFLSLGWRTGMVVAVSVDKVSWIRPSTASKPLNTPLSRLPPRPSTSQA